MEVEFIASGEYDLALCYGWHKYDKHLWYRTTDYAFDEKIMLHVLL